MAEVRLEDLFAADKNFYGLLNADMEVSVEIPAETLPMVTEEYKKLVDSFGGRIRITDLMATELNAPEWRLLPNGILVNFDGPYEIDGKYKVIDLLHLDYRKHLESLSEETLRAICNRFWRGKDRAEFVENFLLKG